MLWLLFLLVSGGFRASSCRAAHDLCILCKLKMRKVTLLTDMMSVI
jgi:hypothetical protein